MSPSAPQDPFAASISVGSTEMIPTVVVIDPAFDAYRSLAASGRLGKLQLHFRASGAEGLKLARRRRVDLWLVGSDLEDMSGNDFLELLKSQLDGPKLDGCKVAAVEGTSARAGTAREAVASGADAVLPRPATFRDVEVLLGLEEGDKTLFPSARMIRAFMTLPIAIGSAVAAIAVLLLS